MIQEGGVENIGRDDAGKLDTLAPESSGMPARTACWEARLCKGENASTLSRAGASIPSFKVSLTPSTITPGCLLLDDPLLSSW
jgi:hypothetical protein